MNYTKIGTFAVLIAILTASLVSASTSVVYSTDSTGTEDGWFNVGQDLYAKGTDFEPGERCDIAIFENGNWEAYDGHWDLYPAGSFPGTGSYNVTVGDTIPMGHKVAGPVTVTIKGDGTFDNVLVWQGIDKTGNFDIIVDCGGVNGPDSIWDGKVTDAGVSRDGVDVDLCVGLTVVPESVITVGLIALFVPGMIYIARKRK